jgi:hypothetical protein
MSSLCAEWQSEFDFRRAQNCFIFPRAQAKYESHSANYTMHTESSSTEAKLREREAGHTISSAEV